VGKFSPKGCSSKTTAVSSGVATSVGASVAASVGSGGTSVAAGSGAQAAIATPSITNTNRYERNFVNLVISFSYFLLV
jgi:hypothetical protein